MTLSMAVLATAPAAAELGGGRPTIEADRAHLAAAMVTTPGGPYTVMTLTPANGGTVREFAATDGMVFAVAWTGPGRPDLRQLLGAAFDTFQTWVTTARRGRRQPLVLRSGDLVVHSAGHPGAFWGFAYLPAKLPAGFTADTLG